VRVVLHKPTGKHMALKMLRKTEIVRLRQVEHLKNEVQILSAVSHPFIVNLLGHTQDERRLYMLMEFVPGGELFTKLRNEDRFSTEASCFYAAEIALAFEHLHSMGVVYRDLKPENLLFSAAGHVKIADFGFAKRVGSEKTFTVCGTPEYLAPEIIQTTGHGIPVDWWALGVLIYEMLAGIPPFFDETPYGIYQQIIKGKLKFPRSFDAKAADLVSGLLTMDPTRRLGCLRAGAADVKAHRFFSRLDWRALASCAVEPPFVPDIRTDGDTVNFPEDYPDSDDEARMPSSAEQAAFRAFDEF